jgi:hypothetical protein
VDHCDASEPQRINIDDMDDRQDRSFNSGFGIRDGRYHCRFLSGFRGNVSRIDSRFCIGRCSVARRESSRGRRAEASL